MDRVGEAYRPETGQTRPAAGFLAGAASLLGLRRLFSASSNVHPTHAKLGDGPLLSSAAPRAEEPVAGSARVAVMASAEPPAAHGDIERMAARVTGARRLDRASRVLMTYSPSAEAPLAGLDSAALASDLARSLSYEGRTILVVFGTGGGLRPGLSELIEGSASFSEAIHREAGARLHILPSGYGCAAPGAGLDVVLDALSETYDFLVLSVDAESGDELRRLSISLAPRADHVLIACPGQTGSPDMVALRDALKDEGAGEVVVTRLGALRMDTREAA